MNEQNSAVALGVVGRAARAVAGRGHRFGSMTGSIAFKTHREAVTLTFENGHITSVDPGTGVSDLVIESVRPHEPGSRVVPRAQTGGLDQAKRWKVGCAFEASDLIPPLDHLDSRWADDLPALPGVHLDWSTRFTDTPFGDLVVTYRVRDGRVTAVEPTWCDDADVWFVLKWSSSVGARSGRLTIPETLADGGDCSGDLDALLLLAGLQETPAWQGAREISTTRERALMLLLEASQTTIFDTLQEFTDER